MFRTVPLSIIRSFSLYTQQWHMSYRFVDGLRAGANATAETTVALYGQKQKRVTTMWHVTAVFKLIHNFMCLSTFYTARTESLLRASAMHLQCITINCNARNNENTYIKGKAVPLQAWGGPEGSRKLRFPDFVTTAQGGGKVVSLTHRPHLPQGNSPGTHFC